MSNRAKETAHYKEGRLQIVLTEGPTLGVTSLVQFFADTGKSAGPQESIWVVAIDGAEQVRSVVEIAKGGYHEVDVSLPLIYAAVLTSGFDRFVLVHNHPTDDAVPTMPDMDLTRKVMAGANTVGLYFDDHIIVTPTVENYFSMAEHGLIRPSTKLTSMAATNKRVNIATASAIEG